MQSLAPAAAFDDSDRAVEANHRITNHLAMLVSLFRMHAQRMKNAGGAVPAAEVGLLIDGLGSKVEAVAQLHRRLADARVKDARILLGDYLNELCGVITNALPISGRIGLDLELDSECSVTSNQALPIGLIVCELVTNSVKYAHPAGIDGRVTVRCRRMGSDVLVEVEDDGVGLPEGLDPQEGGNLGFRSIHALANQLEGTISFRNDDLGMVAALRVPVVADEMALAAV
jgi:two-component sensor histidine kinase